MGIRPFYDGRGLGPPRSSAPTERNGSPPRLPGQRLAKRKARKEKLVKFSLCPMTSECSTAQKVRKSQQSPARAHVGITSSEQNGLAPHPAARQGASRARNCAATSVFSFDGSTAVFFLVRQKENGGWKARRASPAPPGGVWSPRPTGATLAVCSNGPMYLRHGFRRPNFVPKFGASVIGIGPYENTKRRRSRHDRPGQWRRVKRLRRGCKERVGITAEIIPKVSSNLGQSLSRPLGDSSLCTREPFPARSSE